MNSRTTFDHEFLPILFKRGEEKGDAVFLEITSTYANLSFLDLFENQKKELFKLRNPKKALKPEDLHRTYLEWINNRLPENEGVWVFYPWSGRLIHVVDEAEFIELRTNRNHYKITPQEQNELATRKIGIIGLSVGHSVALNLATERTCGLLKLADFDTIELSNLNRIKTGIHNIGVNKCVVTAREIAELDPFLKIECYTEGLHEGNIESFLLEGGKLDLLIDECDGIDMKIRCREEAQKHRIPVVMETSDRGMLDVERFDKTPERPIFHGLLGNPLPKNLSNLSNEEKIPIVLKIVNVRNGSLRGKTSMIEVGQTISTWPQLASAVSLGGGVVTDVSRRILLNQFQDSGRYYIDLEELVKDADQKPVNVISANPFTPFNLEDAERIIDSVPDTAPHTYSLPAEDLEAIVHAACFAPSTGNDQPWKWVYQNNRLYLFHDQFRSYSFGDFDNIASDLSFGAACENLRLKSHELGHDLKLHLFPLGYDSTLIAAIDFFERQPITASSENVLSPRLVDFIFSRCTNRNPSQAVELSSAEKNTLKIATETIPGAVLRFVTNRKHIDELGQIIGECDRIRLLNDKGHTDFVNREMRWTPEDAEATRDGIDVRTLGLAPAEVGALSIVKDYRIAKMLKTIDGGAALIQAAAKTTDTTACMAIITMPRYDRENFVNGGIALQRFWLQAEELGFALHPLISPFYLFPRVLHGQGAGLDSDEIAKLTHLRERFLSVVPLDDNLAEVFLCKVAKAATPAIKTLRLPLSETLFTLNNK